MVSKLPDFTIPSAGLARHRESLTPGTAVWSWQGLESLRHYFAAVTDSYDVVEKKLNELVAAEVWNVIPPERPFGDLETMLTTVLGVTEAELRGQVVDARKAKEKGQHAAVRTTRAALPADGSIHPGNARKFSAHSQDARARYAGISDRQQRKLDRLWRERPDLLAAVRVGTLSVHRACIEAGISEETITVPLDPEKMARAIRRRLTDDEVVTLIDALGEGDSRAETGQRPATRPVPAGELSME